MRRDPKPEAPSVEGEVRKGLEEREDAIGKTGAGEERKPGGCNTKAARGGWLGPGSGYLYLYPRK